MVGGCLAHYKPLTCSFQSSCHRQLVHRTGPVPRAVSEWHSKQARRPLALRVAQQLGDTLTGVGNTAAESQQLEDELRESIEQEVPVEVPPGVLTEFEHELEEDLASVAVTLTAVTGVIIFWRGVWSLLDYFLGDSIFGDICCIFVGLTIVLGIRLSGVKVSSNFWPNG